MCGNIADLARELCSTHINPEYKRAFSACKLVPLSKPPDGVRPVGVGEVLMQVMNPGLVKATAPIQYPGVVRSPGRSCSSMHRGDCMKTMIQRLLFWLTPTMPSTA